jgi:hypothetical protein
MGPAPDSPKNFVLKFFIFPHSTLAQYKQSGYFAHGATVTRHSTTTAAGAKQDQTNENIVKRFFSREHLCC